MMSISVFSIKTNHRFSHKKLKKRNSYLARKVSIVRFSKRGKELAYCIVLQKNVDQSISLVEVVNERIRELLPLLSR